MTKGLPPSQKDLRWPPGPQNGVYEAELWRVRGELRLLQASGAGDAEELLGRAVDIACRQGARWLELRALVRMPRLRQRQGRANKTRHRLAELYSWFTEGLATADVQEARTLLEY